MGSFLGAKASTSELQYRVPLVSLPLHQLLQSLGIPAVITLNLLGNRSLPDLRGIFCYAKVLFPIISVPDAFIVHHEIILSSSTTHIRPIHHLLLSPGLDDGRVLLLVDQVVHVALLFELVLLQARHAAALGRLDSVESCSLSLSAQVLATHPAEFGALSPENMR